MLFKEYTYSVLIVSSSAKFNEAILPLLPENEFGPIKEVKTTGAENSTPVFLNFPRRYGGRITTSLRSSE